METLLNYISAPDGVRHPTPLDDLPLWYGDQRLPAPDLSWIWVYQKGGTIKGILVGCPCHGVAMLIRLIVFEEDLSIATRLLRVAAREVKSNGYNGWVLIGSWDRPEEAHLLDIAKRFGATFDTNRHAIAAGAIPESF